MTDNEYKEHTRKIIENISELLRINGEMEGTEIATALDYLVKDDEFVEKIALGFVDDLRIGKVTIYKILP